MAKATKVLYDVSQAIKELTKLDKKVKASGSKAKKGFEEGASGASKYERALAKINPKAADMLSKASKMKVAIGGVGVAFGVATGAVVGATAAFLDFNNSLRDGEAAIGDWIAAARDIRQSFDNISAGEDAERAFEFLGAKEAIAERRLQLTQLQVANDARAASASEAVATEKSKLSGIESALKASHRRTLDAEKRLADKRTELAGSSNEFGNESKGRQVVSLSSKAGQLANAGRVDEAEAMIEKAKALSEELGNHAFFTDKIDRANGAVVRALEKNVKTSKAEESTLQKQLSEQKNLVAAADERLQKEIATKKELANQLKVLGAISGKMAVQRKLEKQLTRTDEGARAVTSEQSGIKNEITNVANTSGFVEGLKVLGNAMKRISLKSGFGSGQDIDDARDLQGRVLDTAARGASAQTPAELKAVELELAGLKEEIARFRSEVKTGERNSAALRPLDKLAGVLNGLRGLGEKGFGSGNLGAVGHNETIQAAQTRQRDAADIAQDEVKALQQNITYNVKIEGGMIDEKTIAELEKRLTRRERKGTSTSKE